MTEDWVGDHHTMVQGKIAATLDMSKVSTLNKFDSTFLGRTVTVFHVSVGIALAVLFLSTGVFRFLIWWKPDQNKHQLPKAHRSCVPLST